MNYHDHLRLTAAFPHMTAWGRETVTSILAKAARYGSLTPGQETLVQKLIAEAEGKAAKPAQAPETIDLSRINVMFDKAAESLKKPRVQFLTDTAGEFTVSKAPATGKNPGSLYVKSGSNYLGKISAEGVFSGSREAPANVLGALKAFAADPAKAAHAFGQATGSCCFCARELTDARSVEVGYGPICADRYGLPWGVTAIEGDAFYQNPEPVISERTHDEEEGYNDYCSRV